ncbi:MAG: hypothetical protein KC547_14990, partial [Anaerolineae bacterium]|nr:hypothetical protein [Anaerolineae bacterium]
MRKYGLLIVVLLMSLLFAAVTYAADVGVTLDFPLDSGNEMYYDVFVSVDAGDTVTVTWICNLQSTDWYFPGSIDPYLEVYAPDGGFVDWADDQGSLDCAGFNDSILTFVASQSGVYTISAWDISGNGGSGTLTVSGATVHSTNLTNPLAADGRLNPEPWATAFVYCVNGYIDVYQLFDGQGQRVIHELRADIDALGDVAENTLIASSPDGTIRLYKLTSGELQVNAPMGGQDNGY